MAPEPTASRPQRRADLSARYDRDQAVLVHPDGTEAGVLNGTAVALWELCDGSTTSEEMTVAVCDAYSLDSATARREVTAALRRLRRAGFIFDSAEHAASEHSAPPARPATP